MLRLDSTLRKLQIVLAGAITTNQLPVVVCFSDKTSTTYNGGTTVSNTNSTTAVDICAAPGASTIRDIDSITVQNADTAAATVTIQYNDNGTTYSLFRCTLSVGDQIIYTHGQGWKVLDSSGALKSLSSDTVTLAGAQTLTNKTIALGSNTISGTTAEFNSALTDGDFATQAGTETLTNKTIVLGSNTVSGTKAEFDSACSDDNFAYVGQANTFTQPQAINRSGATSIAEYAIDVRQSSSTTNAGRPMFSQGATYGFTWSVNSSGSSSAFVDFQWVQRSDGALQSTPLRLRYNGNAENPTGSILVTNSSGLVGYGAGAGGTVTQGTSRTTAVTLNKQTGEVTLFSAAGSTSWQSFTVNNSLVAATDHPTVIQKSGTDLYAIHVTAVAAGSFRITFATTGGTTTEQPVFRFTVLKGVSA